MFRYALTIFLSAFLLFQIQPIIAKFILPWYGGSSAVWTTSMMFFQIVLLGGYLYAHFLRVFLSPRVALGVHAGLLLGAVALLKQEPPAALEPTGGENLTLAILRLLAVTVGLPFFALSSTGPLIQAWHNCSHGDTAGQSTYRLYALSNTGSMLALLTYPFLIEPVLPIRSQTFAWSIGFILFGLLSFWSGWQTRTRDAWTNSSPENRDQVTPINQPASTTASHPWTWLIWIGLATAPSILLLAITNLMCAEVASVPFLWILPLTLYLVSLIICFDTPAWYVRSIYWPLTLVTMVGSMILLHAANQFSLIYQVIGYSFSFFVWCMTCHGELERLKPSANQLTLYYLLLSTGGALGGILVVVIAPHVFVDYCELQIGLLLMLLLCLAIRVLEALSRASSGMDSSSAENRKPKPAFPVTLWVSVFAALSAGTCVFCSLLYFVSSSSADGMVGLIRNEYGLVSVRNKKNNYRIMVNGRTEHGGQILDPAREMEPSGYYVDGCGPPVAFKTMRRFRELNPPHRPLKVGVVGLGTGSLVTWSRPGDRFTFFEINPACELLARKHFTYLDRMGDRARVILGDGRVQLRRLLEKEGPQEYDLLFLDAFTSDSIPAHLITQESFELYLKHLSPDGIIIAHITNRFVDLRGVIKGLADRNKLEAVYIEFIENGTDWVLLSPNAKVLDCEIARQASKDWPRDLKTLVWTDDFTSLAQVVDWSFRFRWNRTLPIFQKNKKKDNQSQENDSPPGQSATQPTDANPTQ